MAIAFVWLYGDQRIQLYLFSICVNNRHVFIIRIVS